MYSLRVQLKTTSIFLPIDYHTWFEFQLSINFRESFCGLDISRQNSDILQNSEKIKKNANLLKFVLLVVVGRGITTGLKSSPTRGSRLGCPSDSRNWPTWQYCLTPSLSLYLIYWLVRLRIIYKNNFVAVLSSWFPILQSSNSSNTVNFKVVQLS